MDAATAEARLARAIGFMDGMQAMKGTLRPASVADRYDRLREEYVEDKIDLVGFAAEVVKLLLEGL